MRYLSALAIAALGAATACSARHETVQRPVPVPATSSTPSAAASTTSISDTSVTTPTLATTPTVRTLNSSDPPLRVNVSP